MLYDIYTSIRIKKPYNNINWLHKAIKEPSFNLCQCLFGLHLINEDYQNEIAIVESEKTAITIYLPIYIWLAADSSGNFKYELLKSLKKKLFCVSWKWRIYILEQQSKRTEKQRF